MSPGTSFAVERAALMPDLFAVGFILLAFALLGAAVAGVRRL